MADFMGNAPAKQTSGLVFAFSVRFYRYSCHHAGRRSPADTDVGSAGIHKGTFKHSLVTDVDPAHRHLVSCICLLVVYQRFVIAHAFMLVAERKKLIHSFDRIG